MIKTKVAFLEGRLLFNQSEQFKKFSKSSDWLEKAGPPKSHFCFDHVNRLIETECTHKVWIQDQFITHIFFMILYDYHQSS